MSDVDWGGLFVALSLLVLAFDTMPWGLLILAGLAMLVWRG